MATFTTPEVYWEKLGAGRRLIQMLNGMTIRYHPLYPRNQVVRKLLPMVACSSIRNWDSKMRVDIQIDALYVAPSVEVEYDTGFKKIFSLDHSNLNKFILDVQFYKNKIIMHESMLEEEEAGEEWDPEAIEAAKREASGDDKHQLQKGASSKKK
eukprot:TRINITY_DN1307_c0_g1_i1.p1 TRINITY_DN1307_c0_g1~~TRINITY_DN1307_c0_g1_i1.p1  ORF type:complete len:154 (-),score=38.47 TRINITY_DN1307_c0_g1_i1:17-478(-)